GQLPAGARVELADLEEPPPLVAQGAHDAADAGATPGPRLADGADPRAVRAHGDADDAVRVRVEGRIVLARPRVPELDRLVLAGAGEQPAVGADGRTQDVADVPLQGVDLPARLRVPDLDGAVGG